MERKNEKKYEKLFRVKPVTYKRKTETSEQRKEKLKATKELNDFFSDERKQLTIW
jgi:hypothetical protein